MFMRRSLALANLGVLILFLILALWLCDPLMWHFTSAIPGPPADNFEFLWKVDWYKRALFDLHCSPLYTDVIFYPFGYSLISGSATLAPSVLSLPVTVAGGHILCYNTIIVLSLVLSGFGAYLLVVKMTGSWMAGLGSGIIFGFCPAMRCLFRAGHFNLLVGLMWLPYLLLCLEEMLKDHGIRWGIAGGIFCGLIIFSEWYFVPFVGIILVIYLLCRVQTWHVHVYEQRFLITMASFFCISLFYIGLALMITRPLWSGGNQAPPYSLGYVDYISPSLDYFFVPYVIRTLFGQPPVSPDVYEISLVAYMGLFTLVLAIFGAVTRRQVARGFAWMALSSLVLALGPRLRWGGEPVLIPVPEQVEEIFTAGMHILATRLALTPMPSYYQLRVPAKVYIPLPALFLQLFVPFLNKMRYWSRFSILVELAVAVLAGIGLANLSTRKGQASYNPLLHMGSKNRMIAQRLLAVAAIAAIFLEFAILPYHIGYSEVRPQSVDLWLAQQEGDFAIAEFPYYREGGPGPILYRTLFHGKKTCSGAGTFPPAGHRAVRYLLDAFPSPETISLLKNWEVKYILVGARSYGEQWADVQRKIEAQSNLRLVAVFDDQPIYHDVGFWNVIPGYSYEPVVDRVYLYELVQ